MFLFLLQFKTYSRQEVYFFPQQYNCCWIINKCKNEICYERVWVIIFYYTVYGKHCYMRICCVYKAICSCFWNKFKVNLITSNLFQMFQRHRRGGVKFVWWWSSPYHLGWSQVGKSYKLCSEIYSKGFELWISDYI